MSKDETIKTSDQNWKLITDTITTFEKLGLGDVFNEKFLNRFDYEGQASARYFLDILINNGEVPEIFKQDENEEEEDPAAAEGPPIIFGEEIDDDNPGCVAPFVTSRQERDWYVRRGFSPIATCDEPKNKRLGNSVSIPIYYVAISNNWPNAREKMEEARTWFARYCINLQIHPVIIKNRIKRNMIAKLAIANNHSGQRYTRRVGKTYGYIWKRHLGGPKKFLLVLFVDHFASVRYSRRGPAKVAANFDNWPVILIPDNPDVGSTNIVTHELIHGLGKKFRGGSPALTNPYGDRKNCWDEGHCEDEMGNSQRGDNREILEKANDSPMDFASIFEMKARENIW